MARTSIARRLASASTAIALTAAFGAQPALGAAQAGPAIVDLQVTDPSGIPVARSKVMLSVMWPTEQHWSANNRTHGRQARTDATGRAQFRLKLSQEEQLALADNGGWLNLQLMAFDKRGLPAGVLNFSRYFGDNALQREQEDPTTQAGRLLSVRSDSAVADRSVAGARQAAGPLVAADVGTCYYWYWERYSTDWAYTRTGELHSAADTIDADYLYGTSSDATIDVAFKSGTGAWQISGTAHSGESITTIHGLNKASNFHWGVIVPFNYVLLFLYKDCTLQQHVYAGQQQVVENGYHIQNGLSYSIVMSQPARNTSHPEWALRSGPDTSYMRETNKFKKYTAAVSVWGASLGAQSGSSQFVRMYWRWGHAQTWHWLYGNGYHPNSAPVIYASNS
jgi:hypothetical protein